MESREGDAVNKAEAETPTAANREAVRSPAGSESRAREQRSVSQLGKSAAPRREAGGGPQGARSPEGALAERRMAEGP